MHRTWPVLILAMLLNSAFHSPLQPGEAYPINSGSQRPLQSASFRLADMPAPASTSAPPTGDLVIHTSNLDRLTYLGEIGQPALGEVSLAEWSPDGQFLAVAAKNNLILLDASTRETAWQADLVYPVTRLLFSPDGSSLAATTGHGGSLFAAASGRELLDTGGYGRLQPGRKAAGQYWPGA